MPHDKPEELRSGGVPGILGCSVPEKTGLVELCTRDIIDWLRTDAAKITQSLNKAASPSAPGETR
ncbi:hypothetical protein N7494_002565 [Penicillium frequentans]|uniref:Uncharacterized protein n=1 Tax=Penicillium frequentans TaxID=3151616 RepID=A0AAD6D3X0_9EURO|nr:hypothetical protein N7494_002565 [Penicillium glabrum]